MGNLQFIQEKTKDGLTLPGFHWPTTTKRCCVLMVHGMYSNLFENQFAIALANQLPTLGIGFFYGHNRGYGFINSIPTDRLDKDGSFINQRLGTVYERFEDSLLDLQLWLTTIQNLGYSSIILCGHSLGCNKILYYLANRPATMVDGIILASAPDMVHLGQQGANAQVLSEEAQQ